MKGVEALSNILTYILIGSVCLLAVLALVILIARIRHRTVQSGKASKAGKTSANLRPVSETVPLDGFYSGMIVQNDGHRFTAGVRCYGFDFFSSDESAQRNCISGYRGLILSVDSSVSLYSAYHSFDISKQITKHEQALSVIRKELAEAKEQLEAFEVSVTEMSMAEAAQRRDELDAQRAFGTARVANLQRQEQHMLSMINYLNGFTEGQEEQFQDYAYFVSYEVPYDEYDEPFEVRADGARHELDIKIHNLRSRLGSVGVSVKRLTDEDLQLAVYRHSHPSGRNVSDEEILSLLSDRRTVGHDGIVRTGV